MSHLILAQRVPCLIREHFLEFSDMERAKFPLAESFVKLPRDSLTGKKDLRASAASTSPVVPAPVSQLRRDDSISAARSNPFKVKIEQKNIVDTAPSRHGFPLFELARNCDGGKRVDRVAFFAHMPSPLTAMKPDQKSPPAFGLQRSPEMNLGSLKSAVPKMYWSPVQDMARDVAASLARGAWKQTAKI